MTWRRALALLLLTPVLLLSLSGALILRDAERRDEGQADAAIVLGAAAYDAKPSPVLEGRLEEGLALYREGRVGMLIFTGGIAPGARFSEAEVSRRWAMRHGVPAADIRVEQRSRITEENLREAWYIVQAEGLGRVLIVTDPLHMRRSMRLAHDLGLDAGAAPTRSSRYKTAGAKLPFFAREVWLLTGWEVLRLGGL